MNDDGIKAPKMGEEFTRKAAELAPQPVSDAKEADDEPPKSIEAPALKLRPPGLGTDAPQMPISRRAPGEDAKPDRVEGKTFRELRERAKEGRSLAQRAFDRASRDRER